MTDTRHTPGSLDLALANATRTIDALKRERDALLEAAEAAQAYLVAILWTANHAEAGEVVDEVRRFAGRNVKALSDAIVQARGHASGHTFAQARREE